MICRASGASLLLWFAKCLRPLLSSWLFWSLSYHETERHHASTDVVVHSQCSREEGRTGSSTGEHTSYLGRTPHHNRHRLTIPNTQHIHTTSSHVCQDKQSLAATQIFEPHLTVLLRPHLQCRRAGSLFYETLSYTEHPTDTLQPTADITS